MNARRTRLQSYAQRELAGPNKAQAFLNIVAKAVELNASSPNPGADMIGDLKAVLVGENLTDGRGQGPHWVGDVALGASGFKPHLQGPNQVHHAAASLVIAFEYGGKAYGPILEQWLIEGEQHGAVFATGDEQADAALYKVMFAIGGWIRDLDNAYVRPDAIIMVPGDTDAERLRSLPELLREAICDKSCHTPDSEDLEEGGELFNMETDANASATDMEAEANASEFDMEADISASNFDMEADANASGVELEGGSQGFDMAAEHGGEVEEADSLGGDDGGMSYPDDSDDDDGGMRYPDDPVGDDAGTFDMEADANASGVELEGESQGFDMAAEHGGEVEVEVDDQPPDVIG